MPTSGSWNGTSYSIPTTGETNWGSAATAILRDLLLYAQTTNAQKAGVRTATSTPVTVVSTDYLVITNMSSASAVAVTLPTGVAKQIFVVVDGKGDAASNNITIAGTGGQQINGSASYVINNNKGAVALQFDSTSSTWKIIGAYHGTAVADLQSDVTGLQSDLAVAETDIEELRDDLDSTIGDLATHTAATAAHGATGAVVGTTNSQTLTNKTIDADSNTISNIANAQIKAAAAIARSKIATGTASHVLINDGSGNFSSEAQLATTRGGTGLSSIGTALQVLRVNAGATGLEYAAAGGDASSVESSVTDGQAVVFSGTTGKNIKKLAGTGVLYQTSSAVAIESQLDKTRGGTGISSTATFPASGTVVTRDATETLTNKTLTTPTINGATLSGTLAGACTTSGLVTMTGGAIITGRDGSSSPAAGVIGELLEQQRVVGSAAVYPGSGTEFNVTASALSLTAGTWDVQAYLGFSCSSGTVSQMIIGVSSASATRSSNVKSETMLSGLSMSTDQQISSPVVRISVTSTTSYYAVGRVSSSGSGSYWGGIRATRVY